jgi:hypothetical protein
MLQTKAVEREMHREVEVDDGCNEYELLVEEVEEVDTWQYGQDNLPMSL